MKRLFAESGVKGRMKKYAFSVTLLSMIVILLSRASGESPKYGSSEDWGDKYYKAGAISIYDPKMGAFGSVDGDKALMHFNIVDVGKFAGHLCAGSTSGFMITKIALQNLYANGEIPERGDILLTTSAKGEPMEIAAFIIGVSDEDHHGFMSWMIDKSLAKKKGHLVFVFERISTGKRVKITWNKAKTIKAHVGDVERFKKMKMKTVHGLASDTVAKEWGRLVNGLAMKIINGEVKYKVEVLNQGTAKPTKSYREGCRCHDIMS